MLIGFENIEKKLTEQHSQNRLHHAILFSGKNGIGKASFAKNFAKKILQNTEIENHPDLLLIKKDEEKKEISVEKIREIAKFFNQTSAISKNKIVIIDSADELNRSSSNALLKILEEPNNNNFLFLISHSISKLLPTIISRCQIVKINDLSFKEFCQAVENSRPKILPKISQEELKILSLICDKCPAKAIKKGDDMIFYYEKLLKSFQEKIIDEDLIKKISDKKFDFNNFIEILDFFLLRFAKYLSNQIDDFILQEKAIFQQLKPKLNLEKLFSINEKTKIIFGKTISLNLDKKLSVINFYNLFFNNSY